MQNSPANLDTWVLAGQSNMQGWGLLADSISDERVWSFTSAGCWEIAKDPLVRLWESFTPVHQLFCRAGLLEEQINYSDQELAKIEAETRVAGASLGIAFGAAMADALGKPIGLIPAAHGGTSLDQWSPALKDQGGCSLYGAMLERIHRAGGNLRGVLWYQGESDAIPELAATYRERFISWVKALRSDLNRPDLPVIVVQLGRFVVPESERWATDDAWDAIRDAQLRLPDDVPHTAMTSAVDLELTDLIHIGTHGLARLGRRMAKLALHLTDCPQMSTGPRVKRIKRVAYERQTNTACAPQTDAAKITFAGVTGGWLPKHNIRGFVTRTSDNQPHPTVVVVNAEVEKDDPTAIRVIFHNQLNDTVRLGYGLGLDPCCNAVDEVDMPLHAFQPRPIE